MMGSGFPVTGPSIAMALTPYAGVYGRIKAIAITPDFTVPYPTITGTTAAKSGITKWSIEAKDEQPEPFIHFESTVSTAGLLTGRRLTGGTVMYEAPIEGWLDGDTGGTMTLFECGAWIKVDLIMNKTVGTGLYGMGAKITGFRNLGPEAKGSVIIRFACTLLIDGNIPALSTS